MRTRRTTLLLGALVAATVTAAPAADALTTKQVTIRDYYFSPSGLTIAHGSAVKWSNSGRATHTVTSNTGLFTATVRPGATPYTRTFSKAGTYKYHCKFHPSMVGKIVVT